MDYEDYETIYLLGLDDVITGERAATSEEAALLGAVGAGAPSLGGEEHSTLFRLLASILTIFR